MYRLLTDLFFYLGVLVTIFSFLIGNRKDYPFIYAIISPNYSSAKRISEEIISSDRTRDFEYTSKQRDFPALAKFISNNIILKDGALIKTDCVIEKVILHLQAKDGQEVKDFGSPDWLPAMPISISCVGKSGIEVPDVGNTRSFANALADYYSEKPAIFNETILLWIGIILIVALRGHA